MLKLALLGIIPLLTLGPRVPFPTQNHERDLSGRTAASPYYYHDKTAFTTLGSSESEALEALKSDYHPYVFEHYNERVKLLTQEEKEGFTIMGFHPYGALNEDFKEECKPKENEYFFNPYATICTPPSERSRASKYLIFQNQVLVGYVHFNSAGGVDQIHPQFQAFKEQFPSTKKWLYKEILNHIHPPKKAHIKAYSLDHGGFREKVVFAYVPAGPNYPGQWDQKVFLESYYPLALKDHFEPLIVSNLRHNLSQPFRGN